MGASVAMKAAELDGSRLRAVVLVDVAGRVDRGVGPVIADPSPGSARSTGSAEEYVAAVRAGGLIDPWNSYWEEAYRYNLCAADGGVRTRTNRDAVMRGSGLHRPGSPHDRW